MTIVLRLRALVQQYEVSCSRYVYRSKMFNLATRWYPLKTSRYLGKYDSVFIQDLMKSDTTNRKSENECSQQQQSQS